MQVIDRVLDVDSTLQGERVGMSIDQSALQHIMGVLTDLYSDPELAVLREYSTNALDSHVDAGIALTRPIEVTLPSPLAPFLRVKDYGVGLDVEDIRSIYSQYGTSTKRQSNEVVGMLGLGCKSALTYTDQFTLTSYKDGRCIQVSIGRDENGVGSMAIVADYASESEETGTEIVIPAKRDHDFESKASRFFAFWDEGTVLVNGETPKQPDGVWLTDTLLVSSTLDQSYVVMGNVAYPWPDGPAFGRGGWNYNTNNYEGKHYVAAFVPIGAVQFTPSREALQMTKYTRAKLDELSAEVSAKLYDSLTDQITNAATPARALELHRDALVMVKFDDPPLYQGREIKQALVRDPKVAGSKSFLVSGKSGEDGYRNTRKSGEHAMSVQILSKRTTVWFTGFDGAELTPTKRDKLAVWFSQNNIAEPERIIFVDQLTADERFWLDGQTIYDWTPVAAIKITRTTPLSTSNRPRGAYAGRQLLDWSHTIQADTIDTSKPIVWMQGNRYAAMNETAVKLQLIPAEATIIALPANRIEKFKRDFPTAVRMDDYARNAAKQWYDGLNQDDREAALYQKQHGTNLAQLDPERIDDPALRHEVTLAKRQVRGIASQMKDWRHYLTTELWGDSRISEYVLFSTYDVPKNHDHTYLYVNAAYAAGKE